MRVLTTDSFHYVSYALVRAVRPVAEFVGLLNTGAGGGIARSRYVDAAIRAELPLRISPAALRPETGLAPREARWVETVLRACHEHRVDVFLPTSDYDFYLAAASLSRLADEGIAVSVSTLETVRTALDKRRSMELAHEVGLPAPTTVLVDDAALAPAAAAELGYPVVVKPRLSLGAFGVSLVRDETQLAAATRRLRGWASGIVLQEYVRGTRETSLHGVFDRDSRPLVLVPLAKDRHAGASLSTVIRTVAAFPELDLLLEYVRRLGVRGPANIQLKLDSRTGANTFIEVNARWGANARIWIRMAQKRGIDPVLLAVQAARGEPSPEPARLPAGLTGASPFEDLLALKRYLWPRGVRRLPDNLQPSRVHVLASYLRTYARRPTTDVFWSALLRDPVAVVDVYRRTRADTAEANFEFIPLGSV